jgi:opacity protein-like surface antigen
MRRAGPVARKGDLDFSIAGGPAFASIDNAFSGIAGGGQIGYNWQFGSFVAGFETDFQGSNLKGSLVAPCAPAFCFPAGLSASYSQSVPWFGTARARLGYAQDSWLIYATGGYAYANLETNALATAGTAVCKLQPARDPERLDRRRRHRGRIRAELERETRIPLCRFRQCADHLAGARRPAAPAAPGPE